MASAKNQSKQQLPTIKAAKTHPSKPPLMQARKRTLLSLLVFLLASVLIIASTNFVMSKAARSAGFQDDATINTFDNMSATIAEQPLQKKTELYAKRKDKYEKIAEFYSQNRTEVPLSQISPFIKDAIIATEDPRFYTHHGVDPIAAIRALAVNIITRGGGGGASTITMQYIKNLRIQAAEAITNSQKRQEAYLQAIQYSANRKIEEMRLAIEIEKSIPKDKILEGYLNIALFGGRVYGIQSAAKYYFGIDAGDVSLSQAALLAGMVQNPNNYRIDRKENLPAAKKRRDYVLSRLLTEKKITTDQYTKALAEPIEPKITPSSHGCANAAPSTGFFCNYIKATILNNPLFGPTPAKRLFNFQTKGYKIYSTLDLDIQEQVAQGIAKNVPKQARFQLGAAVSVVQPGTGKILAMAQNTDFNESESPPPGSTAINYNTDREFGGSNGFATGSAYKIFTLANWLQNGFSLYENVDARTRPTYNLSAFADSCNHQSTGTFPFKNAFDQQYTNINAFNATRLSVNTAYLAMAQQLDQCVTRDIAISMGAHRADGNTNLSVPSAILGTNEIAPLSMANAIAGFAADGISCTPSPIQSIELLNGEHIYTNEPACHRAIPQDVARMANTALASVINYGTGYQSKPRSGFVIGKTGTHEDTQTWMIAATKDLALATWVGNVAGAVNLEKQGYYNSRHRITKHILQYASTIFPPKPFDKPTTGIYQQRNITVPDVTSLSLQDAIQVLKKQGFNAQISPQTPKSAPVQSTIPTPGTRVPQGSSILLYTHQPE